LKEICKHLKKCSDSDLKKIKLKGDFVKQIGKITLQKDKSISLQKEKSPPQKKKSASPPKKKKSASPPKKRNLQLLLKKRNLYLLKKRNLN